MAARTSILGGVSTSTERPLTLLDADTPARLEHALDVLADLPEVGVDVERADTDRYWRRAALIQVGGEGRVALVDPLAVADLTPLVELLDERVTVLHALDNDLEPLAAAGVRPPEVADTAIAAALLGLPTGLDALMAEVLDVEPAGNKEAMQRADWSQRPLSAAMRHYAATDVADLPRLWRTLAERLVDAGRWAWYEEELAATVAQPPAEERRAWTRLRGLGRLDAASRQRARALWHTREAIARETDTAPGRIVNDKTLIGLATDPPATREQLVARGLRGRSVRSFGDALLAAVQRPDEAPIVASGDQPGPAPERNGHAGSNGQGRREGSVAADSTREAARGARRPDPEERELADRLRALRAQRAEELGLDPGVLCPGHVLLPAVQARPSTAEELHEALDLRERQWTLLAEAFSEAFGFAASGKAARGGGS